jgi:hypothetical protein
MNKPYYNKELAYACHPTVLRNTYKHALEFGVGRGNSTYLLSKHLPFDIMLFAFDWFKGLPEDWKDEEGNVVVSSGGFAAQKPHIPRAIFFDGLFKDTIPQYLKIAKPIALLHIDCDLYSSTMEVLNGLIKFICSETIIAFDEWFYHDKFGKKLGNHEKKAFEEWTALNNVVYEVIEYPPEIYTMRNSEERKLVRILQNPNSVLKV